MAADNLLDNKKKNILLNKENAITFLQEQSVYLILLILVIYGSFFVRKFLTSRNLTAILYEYSVIGMLAIGQLFVIISGSIDLSQGATLALTSITTAQIMSQFGFIPGVIAGLAVAVLVGLCNGFIVSRTVMPPFLVTLGMMGIIRSTALIISDSKPVSIYSPGFLWFGSFDIGGVPLFSFLWIILAFAASYVLSKRKTGLHIYAVGSNEENARLNGIQVKKVKLMSYIYCNVLTGIGGIIWTARLGTGSPIGGANYELESIASVVIGGASLSGGKGKIGGTLAGVFVFGLISSIMNLSHVSAFWQGMVKGLFILIAISIKPKPKDQN